MNNSLLSNQEYVWTLNDNFPVWVNAYEDKNYKKKLWDWIKLKIREFTIPYSKKKTCEMEKLRQQLEEELKKISKIEIGNLKEEDLNRKKQIEKKLHKIYDYFADGAILRSTCTWYEKGEKSNKYFFIIREKSG